MKLLFCITLFVCGFPAVVICQAGIKPESRLEREIRKLDLAAADALMRKDFDAVDRLFAIDSVTNNPRGGLTFGSEGVKELIRTGVIDYASFERVIENVSIYDTTAVVMGNETIVTNSVNSKPSQTVRRRYTNVWMKRKGRWQLTSRHASVICP